MNLFLVLGAGAIGLGALHLRTVKAAAEPQSAQLIAAKATIPSAPAASPKLPAPGTALYETHRGDTVISVARRYLSQSSYLTSSELAQALRAANSDIHGTFLKAGQELTIPGILDAPIVEKSVAVPKDFEVRAIYLTGLMAGSDHGIKIVQRWHDAGGNAVVFDIKDSDGTVNIPFEHPLIGAHKVYIHDLPKYTHFLHSQGMHAIARIAMFRDERLVVSHPELAVKSKKTGQPWRENGKLVWTDPSHFFGMDGIARPGDEPEHFIGESMDRFELITKSSGAVIRPWLQAFAWRTKTYSPKYIEVQVLTSKNKGGVGFLFWNANNDYSKPDAAMPEMKAAKGQYFRGDEMPAVLKAQVELPR